MSVEVVIRNKSLKPKERILALVGLLENAGSSEQVLQFAKTAREADKALCLSAMEEITKTRAACCSKDWLNFVIGSLKENANSVRRESGRIIGNVATLYPAKMEEALAGLLDNAEHESKVVRWSAAFAIAEILLLKMPLNGYLTGIVEAILERETEPSIQKIYIKSLKKIS